MKTACRWIMAAGLLACTLGLTGCLKFRQMVTVMPDGSGKVTMQIGIKNDLYATTMRNGEDPFEDSRPQAMQRDARGIVAYSQPTIQEIDDFTYMTYHAYFRDINDVSLGIQSETAPAVYTYDREGDGARLTVTRGLIQSLAEDHEPTDPDEADQIRTALADMVIEEHFIMPGNLTVGHGLETRGNVLELRLTIDDMADGTGLIQTLDGVETLTLDVQDINLSDEVIREFNAELELAVENWQAREQ